MERRKALAAAKLIEAEAAAKAAEEERLRLEQEKVEAEAAAKAAEEERLRLEIEKQQKAEASGKSNIEYIFIINIPHFF